jgi:hypothetical protein
MKRFWIGIGLLVAILAAGLWAGNRMRRVHIPCAADLEQAAACAMAEDWAGATALTDRAKQLWQENWRTSAAISNHQPLDEIDALFEELEIYRAREETAAYCASCLYLSERVRDLSNSFRVNWWNLL